MVQPWRLAPPSLMPMAVLAWTVLLNAVLNAIIGVGIVAAADDKAAPDPAFSKVVVPFLKQHCLRCHGGQEPKGELSLERFQDSAHADQEYELWQGVLKMVADGEMPPEDEPQPSPDAVKAVIAVIESELARFDCRSDRDPHPGRVTIRRLNRAEYNNTIRDLVGIDYRPADDFPSDDVGYGFDNIGDVLSIPPVLFERYLAAAESIVQRAFQDPAVRERLFFAVDANGSPYLDAARTNLARFARRAFRRPSTSAELDRLMQLLQVSRESGSSEEESFQVGMMAILTSPHFLFRVEADPAPDDTDGIRALDSHEIATRLSYFLWSSMPDAELFRLADQNQLLQPAVLSEQVLRMLRDPKSAALVKNFAGQWLQLRDLKNMTPDPEQFPDFDEELRAAMLRETELFFESMIHEDRSILEFLTADYSFVNERLARHYGLSGVQGSDFRRVSLNDQRRGILTQGSILLLTSNPTRTSPVKRGKWILENMLADPPPPPPPAVPELDDNMELLGSLRERMEQHRANEACAVCHRQMDTLGFGLENFDAVGAWRNRDGDAEIDASGTLSGGVSFQGPANLMKILADQKSADFSRCLAEKMLTYALGRGLQLSDRCTVDTILEKLQKSDHRFVALVQAIVESEAFLLREAKRGE